jgi:hypothetical protein
MSKDLIIDGDDWTSLPHRHLNGKPDVTAFLLRFPSSCKVHVCELVGNLPSDVSIKELDHSTRRVIRLERLHGPTFRLLLPCI